MGANPVSPGYVYGPAILEYGYDMDTTPEGFEDIAFEYTFSLLVTQTTKAVGIPLIMDRDSDFICRGVAASSGAGIPAPGPLTGGIAFKFRFTDSEGRYLDNMGSLYSQQAGSRKQPRPLVPSVYYPAGSIPLFDASPFGAAVGSGGTINIVLIGVKRYWRGDACNL